MATILFPRLSKQFGSLLLFILFTLTAVCQSSKTAVADRVPLSAEMVNKYISIYEYLLEIKLNKQQRGRLQKGLAHYWDSNDTDGIRQTLSDLKYYGKQDELETLRKSSQEVIEEAFRKDSNDSVSKVLIEAYDPAHPDKIAKTAVKVFADIVGTWKKTDGLIAEKSYAGQAGGVSYTDTETMEIGADGKFTHLKVHSHYSGNCGQTEGTTEKGTVRTEGTKLIFTVLSGSSVVTNNCSPLLNHRIQIKSRTDRFTWTIRRNSNNTNVQTLCLNKSDNAAVCLDKQ